MTLARLKVLLGKPPYDTLVKHDQRFLDLVDRVDLYERWITGIGAGSIEYVELVNRFDRPITAVHEVLGSETLEQVLVDGLICYRV